MYANEVYGVEFNNISKFFKQTQHKKVKQTMKLALHLFANILFYNNGRKTA